MGAYGSPELNSDFNNSPDYQNKNMIKCPKCGTSYHKMNRSCPNCGTNYKKPLYKQWWFWLVIGICLLCAASSSAETPFFSLIGGVALLAMPIELIVWIIKLIADKNHKSTLMALGITAAVFFICIILTSLPNGFKFVKTFNISNNETTDITPQEYKKQCTMLTYQDLARNPKQYKDKDVCFYGEVMQVQENGSHITLLVNITLGDFNIWENTVWVDYTRGEDDYRVLEKDIVNVYGVSQGIKTYISILGNSNSVPYIKAKVVELSAFKVPEYDVQEEINKQVQKYQAETEAYLKENDLWEY